MVDWVIGVTNRHLRPSIGWLRFFLLLAALVVVISAALEVGWVPEDQAIVAASLLGFVFALWLANRHIGPWLAWLLLVLAGLGLAIVLLAQLRPPWAILVQGNPAVATYWEQQMALYGDRLAGWLNAVLAGERTTETMAFATGLAFLAWLLGAFLGWTAARLGKVTWGLAALGLAIALTGYFGRAGAYWLVAFVGLATVAIAAGQYSNLERQWERAGIDYSDEVRVELLFIAAAASLMLMTLAYALPVFNVRTIAEAFRRQPAIAEAEGTLQRVFAGVEQPRPALEEVAAGATVGVLPRAFLLGAAPELLETVVMTATVTTEPASATGPPGHHWRGSSYDVYTGRGWLRSAESERVLAAGEPLPLPEAATNSDISTMAVTQSVQLAGSIDTARYTLGRFVSADRDSVAYLRGTDDLVRVRDATDGAAPFVAASRAALPNPEALRLLRIEDVPADILARYTKLPDELPGRVVALAREVVTPEGAATSPLSYYDQARALESFLHQYPYSLEVGLPPAGADMVDYFLFDLQTGFCDYYASAMVVMARGLGIPARLAIGFLPQASDTNSRQTLRQKDAHSWAEVYFPGTGWVEFEPTAPIPGQESALALVAPYGYGAETAALPPASVAIPERAPDRRPPWPLVLALLVSAIGVGAYWLRRWGRRSAVPEGLDEVQLAFAGLERQARRLGYPAQPSQTPQELAVGLVEHLRAPDDASPGDSSFAETTGDKVVKLADLFSRRQYGLHGGEMPPSAAAEAQALWSAVRPQLRALSSPWRALWRPRHK